MISFDFDNIRKVMKQMEKTQIVAKYERKITPIERASFSRAPYTVVMVVARIKGKISEKMLRNAVTKVQQRHPNLRVRIKTDNNQELWFTSEGVKEIPIEIVPRESEDHWVQVYHDACKIPFEFEERPAIRFILVQSPDISELMIFSHHIICDGMSLAYLARDLMVHLGDPAREVEVLPDPVLMVRDTIPEEVSINRIIRLFVKRINKKWEKSQIYFDQEDYRTLNEAYWMKYKHQMLSIELTEAQTTALVERCRRENVTVNTALTAAILGAQVMVLGDKTDDSIGVGGSLRDRLDKPIGEGMGFYAGAVTLKYKYNRTLSFWDNTRKLHQKLTPLYTTKDMLKDLIAYCYVNPALLESRHFKILGNLVSPEAPGYEKISAFSKRDDVVLSLMKREKMDTLDNIIMGTAVTNLTRMDFPKKYGTLKLDRLIMNPGGAFPLAFVNLVLGAVTCSGKLSLLIEFVKESIDIETMEKIKDQAMEFLLKE